MLKFGPKSKLSSYTVDVKVVVAEKAFKLPFSPIAALAGSSRVQGKPDHHGIIPFAKVLRSILAIYSCFNGNEMLQSYLPLQRRSG
jgi:hypothetical protein